MFLRKSAENNFQTRTKAINFANNEQETKAQSKQL